MRHLYFVIRRLAKSPLFALASVLTLTLAIGANTAIFSVVNGVLLKPLPFEEPERLVGVWHAAPGLGFEALNQSPALHFTYSDENRVFDDIGMYDDWTVTVTDLEEPEQVAAMSVTDRVFPLLRVEPVLGRTFSAEDDAPGSPETTILSHGYWMRRFGGDREVIGQMLRVNGRPREIIGVMPAELRFLLYDPAIYLPFQLDRSEVFVGNFSYQAVARLREDATIESANADVARMIPLAVETFPMPPGLTYEMMQDARFGPNVRPLKKDVVGDVGKVLWVLLGTVGLVLLIACANVANLFLVRAESAQREVALRTALGASRARLAAQSLSDSLVLGFLGGACGLGLAALGLRVLIHLAPENLPRLDEITIDSAVLLFTLGVSLFAGLLFGLFPILQYGSPALASALKEGGRGGGDGRERHRLRGLLVVSQVALASVLLIGSGLMIRSFQALRQVEPGFVRPDEVLTLRVSIPSAEIEDVDAVVRTHRSILERLERIPGVTSVGASSSITMDEWDSNDPLFFEEFPMANDQLPPIRRYKRIAANYHQTMGNPVLFGRAIDWNDIENRNPVVMITENLAREYWDDPRSALGKRVRETPASPWREIVGVVGDIRDDGVSQEATPTVFWPMAVSDMWGEENIVQRNMAYAIRTSRPSPEGMLPEVREAIWGVNPNLPLAKVRTLRAILERSMARTAFTLVMLGIAAGTAVVLGAIGIYGVISYTVSRRVREIGVRMALGARRSDVSWMVLRQGGLVSIVGILLGLLAAFGLTRLMASLLYGVGAVDFATYTLAALAVGAVSLLASYVPARRATSINPVEALRWE